MLGVAITSLAAFFWALASIFYRRASIESTNIVLVNLLRIPLALLFLCFIAFLSGNMRSVIVILGDLNFLFVLIVATPIMNVVGDTLYLLAIRNVGVAIGYPLSYMYPVFVAIFASIILGERIYVMLVVGVTLSVLGIWLISGGERENYHECQKQSFLLGVLAGVGAALSFSLGIILFRIAVFQVDPIVVAILKLILLPILAAPLFIFGRSPAKREISMRVSLIAMLGGVFGLGIGDWLFYVGLASISASLAATITTLSPMVSLILAVFLLGEKVDPRRFIGILLIVVGVLLSVIR